MLVFDIETGPLPEDQLRPLFEDQFQPPPHPGEFDPESVKVGNLKDQAKKDAKIAEARAAHEAAVQNYEANVQQAKAEWWMDLLSKAALSPLTGRILAIGYRNADNGKQAIDGDESETVILENFWRKYHQCRSASRRMCGFNILGFDVPFVVRRSWLLGVDVPDTVIEKGRYLDGHVFIDLMQLWGCGNREYIQLDALTKAFGIGGKPEGINGGDFARLWTTDRDAAEAYLANDLDLETKLAARLGVVA